MHGFELICIDMFQTLVDVDVRIPFIWERILRDKYNKELGEECSNLVIRKVVNKFHEDVSRQQEFLNLKSLFKPYFLEINREIGIDFDPEDAVEVFLDEHGKATPYKDALELLKIVGDSIPVCLVSDADIVMVEPLLKLFKFDEVFISESVKSYKNDSQSRIFKEVLNHYGINPKNVIHIGDASSDIIGANKLGITTCWINRYNREWKYDIKPDYIVKSLTEVADIIGIKQEMQVCNNF